MGKNGLAAESLTYLELPLLSDIDPELTGTG